MEVPEIFKKRQLWGKCLLCAFLFKGIVLPVAAQAVKETEGAVHRNSEISRSDVETHPEAELNGEPTVSPILRSALDAPVPTNVVVTAVKVKTDDLVKEFKKKLDEATTFFQEKNWVAAEKNLRYILDGGKAPEDLQRPALFLLGKVVREKGELVRAQQIFSQFMHLFPDDANVPEVFLRQGLIYRDMGVTTLAMTKFYSVMSSSLNLKLDRLDEYRKLVLQAQTEIAETYYLQGNYSEASEFFERLLKEHSPDLNEEVIIYKQVRCLNSLGRNSAAILKGQQFLTTPHFANSPETPEVRFLVADSLIKLGRSHEALQQVYLLLQSEQRKATVDAPVWRYWQQRAGNEVANQLYIEKDYVNALSVYSCLADLNTAPTWQCPVWYQIGLVYEQLRQPDKATEYYDRILNSQKDLRTETPSENLTTVISLAKWRRGHLTWQAKAEATERDLIPTKPQ